MCIASTYTHTFNLPLPPLPSSLPTPRQWNSGKLCRYCCICTHYGLYIDDPFYTLVHYFYTYILPKWSLLPFVGDFRLFFLRVGTTVLFFPPRVYNGYFFYFFENWFSTHYRKTYDCLYRIVFNVFKKNYSLKNLIRDLYVSFICTYIYTCNYYIKLIYVAFIKYKYFHFVEKC